MKNICFFIGDITRSGGTERVAAVIANGLVQTGRYHISLLSIVEQNSSLHFQLSPDINRYVLNSSRRWINPAPDILR